MTQAVVGFLVGLLILNTVFTVLRRKSLLARLAGDPAERIRFFRGSIAGAWVLAVMLTVIVAAPMDELHLADVGWSWSTGGHLGLTPSGAAMLAGLLTIVLVGLSLHSAAQTRKLIRAGQPSPIPAHLTVLLPRTPQERRLVAGLAVTAGITEEIVYRGFVIGAVLVVFDPPLPAAAALSLAIFVGGHAYQGRQGMLGVAVMGVLLTLLYVLSGSFLPGMVVHVVQDLVALFTTTATPPPIPAQQPLDPSPTAPPGPSPAAPPGPGLAVPPGQSLTEPTGPSPTEPFAAEPRQQPEERISITPLEVPHIRAPSPDR